MSSPSIRRAVVLWAVPVVAVLIAADGGRADTLFYDDFKDFDEARYEPATSLPGFVGVPQTTLKTLDGRSVVQFESTMTNKQRRGYRTAEILDVSAYKAVTVEVSFKTVGGIDYLLELGLANGQGQGVGMGIFGGNFGNDRRLHCGNSNGDLYISDPNIWSYSTWYRYFMMVGPDYTYCGLYTDDWNEVAGAFFAFGLDDLGDEFQVYLSQGMGRPNRKASAIAAVDMLLVQGWK